MTRDEETFPKVFARVKALYKAQRFTFSDHALDRKGERCIDTVDIENLIRYGRMVGIRRDMKHAGPSYTIEGLSVDNESLGCAVAIEEDLLIIVTAYFKD